MARGFPGAPERPERGGGSPAVLVDPNGLDAHGTTAITAFDVKVTSDDRHLVITSYQGASDHAEVHVVALEDTVRLKPDTTDDVRKPDTAADVRRAGPVDPPVPLVTGFASGWHFIDDRDGHLYFRTDAGAPFGRIVRFDLTAATPDHQVVVAESRDTIVDAAVANGRLLVSSLRDASSRLTTWSLDGGDERVIALPGIGTIADLAGRWTDARSFATFTSFTMPPAIMACEADALVPIQQSALPFDPAEYVTEQVWYPSRDGTPISMFVVSKRDHDGRPEGPHYSSGVGGDGRSPGSVLLTGYGGFNISLTPAFDPSDFLWLDAGGVMAIANLRGGGEYGDAWHRAGMRAQKQNVFDASSPRRNGCSPPAAPRADGRHRRRQQRRAARQRLRYHLFTSGVSGSPNTAAPMTPATSRFCCATRRLTTRRHNRISADARDDGRHRRSRRAGDGEEV